MDQGRIAKRRRRRWMSQNNRLLFPNADVWPQSSDWLIRDEFTDTVAAGSVNGTAATPGTGTRAVTDTESKISVGSGVLAIAGGKTSPNSGDPALWYGAQTRASGLALIFSKPSTAGYYSIGFDTNQAGGITTASWFYFSNVVLYPDSITSCAIGGASEMTGVYALVLQEAGAKFFYKSIAGGWNFLWRSTIETIETVYPAISNYNGIFNTDYLRCIALPAPFDTDDGLATDTKSGAVAAGTTFTHEADMLLEFTVTTRPTAAVLDVRVRKQDANNYWRVVVNDAGTYYLFEIVAGVSTQRASASSVVASGHRIVIIAEGTTIKGYSNNTLRWTYSSASNFATATAGEVDALGTGGAVSDLKTWPRTLSGTAAAILDKVSA